MITAFRRAWLEHFGWRFDFVDGAALAILALLAAVIVAAIVSVVRYDPHSTRTFSPSPGITCIEGRRGMTCLRDAVKP